MADVSLTSIKGEGGSALEIGQVGYFQDQGPTFERNGQLFLRTGTIIDADLFPNYPEDLKNYHSTFIGVLNTGGKTNLSILSSIQNQVYCHSGGSLTVFSSLLPGGVEYSANITPLPISYFETNDSVFFFANNANWYRVTFPVVAAPSMVGITPTGGGGRSSKRYCSTVRYKNTFFHVSASSRNLVIDSSSLETPTEITERFFSAPSFLSASNSILRAWISGNKIYVADLGATYTLKIFEINETDLSVTEVTPRLINLGFLPLAFSIQVINPTTIRYLTEGASGWSYYDFSLFTGADFGAFDNDRINVDDDFKLQSMLATGINGFALTLCKRHKVNPSPYVLNGVSSYNALPVSLKVLKIGNLLYIQSSNPLDSKMKYSDIAVYDMSKQFIGTTLLIKENQNNSSIGYIRIQ